MCAHQSGLEGISAAAIPPEQEAVENRDSSIAELLLDLANDPVLDARLRSLLALIESNPLSTIHDYAQAFNLSHSRLQRLFKQATGVGLGRTLTKKRLLRAAQLVSRTHMSVKEVAHAVGYEHTSSFTRAFARCFGVAPSDYRRRNAA